MTFIYETYNTVSQSGFIDFRETIPSYIIQNLKYPLRPYQEEAIGRYLYYKTDKNRTVPEQYGDWFRKDALNGCCNP